MQIKNKCFAEFVGTAMLVLMGCGSAVLAGEAVGVLGISFAFGLVILALVYVIGPISGCHVNPAVTLAMLVGKKISGADAAKYMVSQFLGALFGAAILYFIACNGSAFDPVSLGQNGFGVGYQGGFNLVGALTAEVVLTAIFLFVICGVVARADNTAFAGIAIGLTLTLIHIVGIPVTGVSVNPARSFGPAMMLAFTGQWAAMCQLWVFIVFPLIGGVIGSFVWKMVSCTHAEGCCKNSK